ncbi:hypothetical protein COL154_014219, partial [Colletotrichum chrysophilum]
AAILLDGRYTVQADTQVDKTVFTIEHLVETPPAQWLEAKAAVKLVPGTGITESNLTLVGTVPGIDAAKFKELAEKPKAECPVSKALGAIKVGLDAKLA